MEGRSTVEDRRLRNSYHRVVMCSWNKQLPNVIGIGPPWATTNVRQKATVVCEVRGSQSTKRLMYEPRDLEHDALTDWQPVQLP